MKTLIIDRILDDHLAKGPVRFVYTRAQPFKSLIQSHLNEHFYNKQIPTQPARKVFGQADLYRCASSQVTSLIPLAKAIATPPC